MCSLNPLPPASEMTPCRLCKAPAVGVLMEAAIVEPWHDGERSPAVDLNVRRVLARGDALCGVCERGVGYFPTTAPDDPEAYTAWWETA